MLGAVNLAGASGCQAISKLSRCTIGNCDKSECAAQQEKHSTRIELLCDKTECAAQQEKHSRRIELLCDKTCVQRSRRSTVRESSSHTQHKKVRQAFVFEPEQCSNNNVYSSVRVPVQK